MNRRILIIVSSALVLSVCLSFLVYRAVGARATVPRPIQTSPVLVAAHDLRPGAVIADADLKIQAWPGALPKGATGKKEGILRRGVAAPVFEGEPVTEAHLAPQGSGGGLSGMIPAGMRACAVKVNEVAGIAGFAVPGMRVDVLMTGVPPGASTTDGSSVRTLLQNIEVLSAGTNFQKDQTGKPEQAEVVNLLVTPAQAEILSLAGSEMHLQLVLRNPMDTEVVKPAGAIGADLFRGMHASPSSVVSVRPQPARGQSSDALTARSAASRPLSALTASPAVPEKAPAPAPARPWVVEVTNGSVHTVAQFGQLPPRALQP
jgi:pilus assembly protein CpaB